MLVCRYRACTRALREMFGDQPERLRNSGLAAAVANCIQPNRFRSTYAFPNELEVNRGR